MAVDYPALVNQLRATLGKMELALGGVSDAIAWTDEEGRLQWCNAAFDRLVGRPRLEVLGADARELLVLRPRGRPPGGWEHPLKRVLAARAEVNGVYDLQTKAGVRQLEISAARLSVAPGEAGAILTARDVTERILAEEGLRVKDQQLAFAQKLESLGRLSGGIAHEINNMLTGVIGLANLIARDVGSGHPSATDAQQIVEISTRAAELVSRLLAFGRRGSGARRSVSLNSVVESNRKISATVLGERARLNLLWGKDLPPVTVDAGQIEQVLVNLYLNSRDAMGGNGTITVETSLVEWTKPFVCRWGSLRPGSYVVLSVADTGRGIAPEVEPRIFEPFFSTKPGKGSGLGLSVAYGIISDHGGLIDFDSRPGQGTTFRVYLPAGSKSEAAAPAAGSGGEAGTVLIVDDELVIRETLARILAPHGYRLLLARDGCDAVEQLKRHHAEVDLVLLDVVMPDAMGPEVRKRLTQLKSGLKIIYMSGYASASALKAIDQEAQPFITKPFKPADLIAKIKTVLAT